MALRPTVCIEIGEGGGAAAARRAAAALARECRFDEQDEGRLALVVTEAATNIEKHAGRGLILLSLASGPVPSTVQVLALDRGPGFDVERGLRDGHSTAGSQGTGLGAISRLATTFDLFASPGLGTVLFAEVVDRHQDRRFTGVVAAGVSVPMAGEIECGDTLSVIRRDAVATILVADGLGHGPVAAVAAREAARCFEASRATSLTALVHALHGVLRPTRGAAVALAQIEPRGDMVRFCGVGNATASVLLGNDVRHLVSHNGTLGHEVRRVQEFEAPWGPEATLVMASDGLVTRWNLDGYPGLFVRHPAVIAGILYRDYRRDRDDVTVVVAKAAESVDARGARR